MTPTQHKSNNGVLGAPAGWNQGKLPCDAVPITRVQYGEHGVVAVQTFWRPNSGELKALNDGALVLLSVIGQTMPPISVGVIEK